MRLAQASIALLLVAALTSTATACATCPGTYPTDCQVSQWYDTTTCSATCGTGTKSQTRIVLYPPSYGGQSCPALTQVVACNVELCPTCPVGFVFNTCGRLTQPTCSNPSPAPDLWCGPLQCECPVGLVLSANYQCIPYDFCPRVDCIVSEWYNDGFCSKTCGTGVQLQRRAILSPPQGGGAACPALTRSVTCNTQTCPVCTDGKVYAECANGAVATCANPWPIWDYLCYPPKCQCPTGLILHLGRCIDKDACPAAAVDCEVGAWYNAGQCSVTCDVGLQMQVRSIIKSPSFDGIPCPDLSRTTPCFNTACQTCPADRVYNQCPSTCLATCDNPTPNCPTDCSQPRCDCPAGQVVYQGQCIPRLLCPPIPCTVTNWYDVTTCSATCGASVKTQQRDVISPAYNAGTVCPELTRTFDCEMPACPICDSGKVYRNCSSLCTPTCADRNPQFCPSGCGPGRCECPSGTVLNNGRCIDPIDCPWTPLTCGDNPCLYNEICIPTPVVCIVYPCPQFQCVPSGCVNGTVFKTCGSVCTQPTCDDPYAVCPNVPSQSCPPGKCQCPDGSVWHDYKCIPSNQCPSPVDCIVGDWTGVEACSTTCGGGIQMQNRSIIQPAQYGGLPCPVLSRYGFCKVQECIPCANGMEYQTCGPRCVATCDNIGSICRAGCGAPGCYCPTGTVLFNGYCIPPSYCPAKQDCIVSNWTPVGACSATCNGGLLSHVRYVTRPAANGGEACPALVAQFPCNVQNCDIKCPTGFVLNLCGRNCTRTCSQPTTNCASDCSTPKCECPAGTYLYGSSCVLPEQCPTPPSITCRDRPCDIGEICVDTPISCAFGTPCPQYRCYPAPCTNMTVYTECGSTCTRTCEDPNPICAPGVCLSPRCECPANLVMINGTCLDPSCCPPPVDCQVSDWFNVTSCSAGCGGGFVPQVRIVVTPPAYGGLTCPPLKRNVTCNEAPCITCTGGQVYTECGSSCVATCEDPQPLSCSTTCLSPRCQCPAGYVLLNGACIRPHQCPAPVDCQVSAWFSQGFCTVSCGGGLEVQVRQITQNAQYGGKACPDLFRVVSCNQQSCVQCPAGFIYKECGSSCTPTCDDPSSSRCLPGCFGSRCECPRGYVLHVGKCIVADQCFNVNITCDDQPCRSDQECVPRVQSCATNTSVCAQYRCVDHTCPYRGQVYSKCASVCDATCESPSPYCPYSCVANCTCPSGTVLNNYECVAIETCPMPVDCVVSAWFPGQCTKTCGGGSATEVRQVLVNAVNGGKACPSLQRTVPCNVDACVVCPSPKQYSTCPCEATCDTPYPACLSASSTACPAGRCQCPLGTLLLNNTCVYATQCPAMTTPAITTSTTTTTTTKACFHSAVDLVFLIDSSQSVGAIDFLNELDFVSTIIAGLNISSSTVRVALMTFSDSVNVVYSLDAGFNSTDLQVSTQAASFLNGATILSDALISVKTRIGSATFGRRDAAAVVIVVTDGRNQEAVGQVDAAAAALRSVATVLFVGFGNYINIGLPQAVAFADLRYLAANAASLYVFADPIVRLIDCSVATSTTTTTTTTITTTRTTTTTTAASTADTTEATQATQGPERATSCGGYDDRSQIVFLLDSSTAVSAPGWRQMCDFVVNEAIFLSSSGISSAVIMYATSPTVLFNFTRNVADMTTALNNAPHLGGSTNTTAALLLVPTLIVNKSLRSGIMLLTAGDEDSTRSRIAVTERVKSSTASTFAVIGLTSSFSLRTWEEASGEQYTVSAYGDLLMTDFQDTISNALVCILPGAVDRSKIFVMPIIIGLFLLGLGSILGTCSPAAKVVEPAEESSPEVFNPLYNGASSVTLVNPLSQRPLPDVPPPRGLDIGLADTSNSNATIVENLHYGAPSSNGSQYSGSERHYGTLRQARLSSLTQVRSSSADAAYDTFDTQAHPVTAVSSTSLVVNARAPASSVDNANSVPLSFSNQTYAYAQQAVYSSVNDLK